MAYSPIAKPSLNFNLQTYSGNGSTKAITGINFEPALVWIKNYGTSNYPHSIFDKIRGVQNYFYTNASHADMASATSLTAFDTDGFTLGANTNNNANGQNYVTYCWKGGTTSVPSGGTITPSYANYDATSGIGIYKYTGTGSAATIAHGLGKVPTFMMVKRIDSSANWTVFHRDVMGYGGGTRYNELNSTGGISTDNSKWNNTNPTDTLFSIGSSTTVNASGGTFMAYLFCDTPGFSISGEYVGTGNADGTFVYCGFRPAFTLIHRLDSNDWWGVSDNKRQTAINDGTRGLMTANTEDAQGTLSIDYLSNGFKLRNTNGGTNDTGGVYQFLSFAAAPIVSNSGTSGVPETAR